MRYSAVVVVVVAVNAMSGVDVLKLTKWGENVLNCLSSTTVWRVMTVFGLFADSINSVFVLYDDCCSCCSHWIHLHSVWTGTRKPLPFSGVLRVFCVLDCCYSYIFFGQQHRCEIACEAKKSPHMDIVQTMSNQAETKSASQATDLPYSPLIGFTLNPPHIFETIHWPP